MRGRVASQTEIAGRRHQGRAEMVHPDAVHDRSSRQRVVSSRRSPGPGQAGLRHRETASRLPPARIARNRRGTGSPGLLGLPRRKTRGSNGVGVSSRLMARAGAPGPVVSQFCTAFRSSCSFACEGRSGNRPKSPYGSMHDARRAVRAVEHLTQRLQRRIRQRLRHSPVKASATNSFLPESARRRSATAHIPVRPQPASAGGRSETCAKHREVDRLQRIRTGRGRGSRGCKPSDQPGRSLRKLSLRQCCKRMPQGKNRLVGPARSRQIDLPPDQHRRVQVIPSASNMNSSVLG